MNIIYTKSYDNGLKKLKKHKIEYDNLLKIIHMIENVDTFSMLKVLPMAKIYNFERLKHNNNKFYSFNLHKHGGTIRLLVKPNNENDIELYFAYISFNHYEDFSEKKVIYYE